MTATAPEMTAPREAEYLCLEEFDQITLVCSRCGEEIVLRGLCRTADWVEGSKLAHRAACRRAPVTGDAGA